MAIDIHLSPTQAFSVFLATPKVQRTQNLRPISVGQFKIKTSTTRETPTGFRPRFTIKAANQSSAVVDGSQEPAALPDHRTIPAIKTALNQSLQGINRGIFGVPSAKKSEIEGLVNLLESQNPAQNPTDNLVKVDGRWKLVYSTISILGIKRTKLGLRDFVSLGNFLQIIDVAQGKAVNVINFHVRGLTLLTGQLRIEASFKIASKTRVDIKYMSSTINPDQLLNLFKKNYDLLLAIFNPEGWLEISYVDESMRIGRDDKGNIFVLERDE